jgi:hypothetical protein
MNSHVKKGLRILQIVCVVFTSRQEDKLHRK